MGEEIKWAMGSHPRGVWLIFGEEGAPAYVPPIGVYFSRPLPRTPRLGALGYGPDIDWFSDVTPDSGGGDPDDVLKIDVSAPKITSSKELTAQIKAAGGKLVVAAYSSQMIVATNNSMSFSWKKLPDGRYEITAKDFTSWLPYAAIGGAFLLLFLKNR